MSAGPEKPETENQASKMSLSKVVAYAPLGHNPPKNSMRSTASSKTALRSKEQAEDFME